jgi:hypothetical protein
MIDPGKNFTKYRQLLAMTPPPCVPYFGMLLLFTVRVFLTTALRPLPQKSGTSPERQQRHIARSYGQLPKAPESMRDY